MELQKAGQFHDKRPRRNNGSRCQDVRFGDVQGSSFRRIINRAPVFIGKEPLCRTLIVLFIAYEKWSAGRGSRSLGTDSD